MLEEEGIIYSRSGAKSCVEVDEAMKESIRRTLLSQDTLKWVQSMKQMGVSMEEALELCREVWE